MHAAMYVGGSDIFRDSDGPRGEGERAEFSATNPYPAGSDAANEWERGWADSHGDSYDSE